MQRLRWLFFDHFSYSPYPPTHIQMGSRRRSISGTRLVTNSWSIYVIMPGGLDNLQKHRIRFGLVLPPLLGPPLLLHLVPTWFTCTWSLPGV